MKTRTWLVMTLAAPLLPVIIGLSAIAKPGDPSPSPTPKSRSAQTEVANAAIEKLWREKLPGKYVLVGKLPGTTNTYLGTLSITPVGDKLQIERKIGAITSTGVGQIGFEPEIPVLEVQLQPNRPISKAGYQLNEIAGRVFLSGYTELAFGGFRPENRGLEFCFPEGAPPEPLPPATAADPSASPSPTASFDSAESNQDELAVLEGVYQILGCNLQTGLTYSGRAFVRAGKSQLIIVRTSGSYAKRCIGSLSGESNVRVELGPIGQFTWVGDADNYARWIGCLYLSPDSLPKGADATKVNRPIAVETWFCDHGATDKGTQNKE